MKRTLFVCLSFFFAMNVSGQFQFETNNTKTYSDSSARKEIDNLYSKLILGENFEDLAEKFTQDPGTFVRGGVLGFIKPENQTQDFADIMTSIELMTISKPFKTEFGYHIIRVLSKNPPKRYLVQHILIRVSE